MNEIRLKAAELASFLHLTINTSGVQPCVIRFEEDKREYNAYLIDNKLLSIVDPDEYVIKRFILLRSDFKLSFYLLVEKLDGTFRIISADEALKMVNRRLPLPSPREVKSLWIAVLFDNDTIVNLFKSFNKILLGDDIKLIL